MPVTLESQGSGLEESNKAGQVGSRVQQIQAFISANQHSSFCKLPQDSSPLWDNPIPRLHRHCKLVTCPSCRSASTTAPRVGLGQATKQQSRLSFHSREHTSQPPKHLSNVDSKKQQSCRFMVHQKTHLCTRLHLRACLLHHPTTGPSCTATSQAQSPLKPKEGATEVPTYRKPPRSPQSLRSN